MFTFKIFLMAEANTVVKKTRKPMSKDSFKMSTKTFALSEELFIIMFVKGIAPVRRRQILEQIIAKIPAKDALHFGKKCAEGGLSADVKQKLKKLERLEKILGVQKPRSRKKKK